MDIITSGDFAITNVGGKTVFSFQVPSTTTINFAPNGALVTSPAVPAAIAPVTPIAQKPLLNKAGRKPERNEQCPCGSGNKYKNCHGR